MIKLVYVLFFVSLMAAMVFVYTTDAGASAPSDCVPQKMEVGPQFGVAYTDNSHPIICGIELGIGGRKVFVPAGQVVANRHYQVRWAGTQIVIVDQKCKQGVCPVSRAWLWTKYR